MTLDGIDSDFLMNSEHEVVATKNNNALATARKMLVVALDKPTVAEAAELVSQLGESVEVYKVGLELVFSPRGLAFAEELRKDGKKIFLDMKLLDIPNTVEKAVANIARLGFDFLTVHGIDRQTLDAAVRGRAKDTRPARDRLKLLSVTVLTSNSQHELNEHGISEGPLDLAVRRAKLACDAGFDGVIASGHEAKPIKLVTSSNPGFIIKVPGIRPANSAVGDQNRVMTPYQAIANGATFLVIGRPISEATDPAAAAEQILQEMASAL